MRVLLTRARERSEKTARKLERAGHEAVILPLMRYRDTDKPVPSGQFDAIALTSAEAVRSMARRISVNPSLAGLIALPAFCVGAATAESCLEAGFADVRSADGDAFALAALIGSPARQGMRLLYPAQPERTLDLRAVLPHWSVTEFTAYEAEPLDPGADAFNDAVTACEVVFLYSSRGASHFVDLLRAHGKPASFRRLTLIAISEKTARAITTGLPDWAKEAGISVAIAASPDEDAMISLLRK
jgi:uroporphyrinogen-III synthase